MKLKLEVEVKVKGSDKIKPKVTSKNKGKAKCKIEYRVMVQSGKLGGFRFNHLQLGNCSKEVQPPTPPGYVKSNGDKL